MEHPCAGGLSPACFAAYPAWARQAFAYKLLHIILPKQLTKNLPRGLNLALVPPGVIIPPGVVLPPGAIVPPGTVFPPGWTPGDPAPPGVQLPPTISPVPPGTGITPPLYVQPWEPGPVHVPIPGPGIKEYTITLVATATELGEATATEWADARDSTMYANVYVTPAETTTPVYVDLSAGNYTIKRSIFKFSLAGIPAGSIMVSGYLSLKPDSGVGVSVCAQTCPEVLWENPNDYISFSGEPSSYQTLSEGENRFNLSTDSLSLIQGKIGSDCFLMAREYDHDYLDTPPGDGELFSALVWKHNAPTAGNRPTLVLTYKA